MSIFYEYEPGEKYATKEGGHYITSDTPDAFSDAGRKLDDTDLVIDIDHISKKTIQKVIDTFNLKTETVWTDRGAHLYFKRPPGNKRYINGVCKLGFEVEYKTSRNSPQGICIKRNGKLRIITNEGLRQDFPEFFLSNKKYVELNGLSDGDGRNQKLYAHKKALGNKKDTESILKFINENVFAEPLDDKEFGTVIRQEVGKGADDAKPENVIATAVIEDLATESWAGSIWFDIGGGIYSNDLARLQNIIYRLYCPGMNTRSVDEVIKQLRYRSPLRDKESAFPIKLKNGYLSKGRFIKSQSRMFTPYYIDINYISDADPVRMIDDYLDQLSNADLDFKGKPYTDQDHKDYRDLILETIAFGLITDPEKTRALSKFFIYRGDGGNGKGTLLSIIRAILGADNCSGASITQLGDPKYVPSLIGKLVNLGDDIEDKPINKEQFKTIKNISTADAIEVRKLYQEPFSAVVTAKLIFTSNSDIKTFDKGDALKRRICWMPMFNRVEKIDDQFISKITTPDALCYWMSLIVKAYERLYTHGFTKSRITNDYNEQYHLHNNIAEMFVDDILKDCKDYDDPAQNEFLTKTRTMINQMFADWNTDDNERKLNQKQFKLCIWRKFQGGYGRASGATCNTIMTQSGTDQNLKPTFK